MNFKNITLIALLLPIASYGKNAESRIKELKETQLKKGLDLSSLGKAIADKNDMIINLNQLYFKNIDENNKDALDIFSDQILAAVLKTKKIKNLLIKELFDEFGNCNSLKILAIRIMQERVLLGNLIDQYEQYLQELININEELTKLDK